MTDANQISVLPATTANTGVVQNNYQMPVQHWAKITLKMQKPGGQQVASNLPYAVVQQTEVEAGIWRVIATGRTPSNGIVKLCVTGGGEYRAYVKEPGATFGIGDEFTIPQHALADGSASGREVQPWFCMVVAAGAAPQTFSIAKRLPNTLGRAVNLYPASASATLTNAHTQAAAPLNLGDFVLTNQLWADMSQAYGSAHPVIAASAHRASLESLYSEQLVAAGNDRTLSINNGARTIEFDEQSTSGGRTTLSFLAAGNNMTCDEALRRTHPSVIEWWLIAMEALNIHFARSTGAWRPHTGSTRHRYASALDLTHLRTRVVEENGVQTEVRIQLHNVSDPDANPLASDQAANTAAKRRKRDFSLAFHRYLGQRKQVGELGWLGGPWGLTYANAGLQGGTFMNTDATHVHHVHLSIGTDQP